MKKIDCILLVDDSASTNFYNKKLIDICNGANYIHEVRNGLEAFNFIKQTKDCLQTKIPKPNIIFLDINMPVMNGFEFLEKFSELPKYFTEDILIVFLTTSNWSKDKERSVSNNLVFDFLEKPLSKETYKRISDYYSNNFSTSTVAY